MRWKLGNYELKMNPKELGKSYSGKNQVNTNVNGQVSNANTIYEGSIDFQIDVFEPPSKVSRTPLYTVYNSVVDMSERRTTEQLYTLRYNLGDVYVYNKDGYLAKQIVPKTTTGITLPAVKPTSIAHCDSEIALLYAESTQATVIYFDENGNPIRKYIYSSTSFGDLAFTSSIAWDYGSNLYMMNKYGKIYVAGRTTGTSLFLMETEDFSTNKANTKVVYRSLHCINKQGYTYLGFLKDGDKVYYVDVAMNFVAMANLDAVVSVLSYGGYSDEYLVVKNSNIVHHANVNRCRIDIDIIKKILSVGQVTMYNELNLPTVVAVKSIGVERVAHKEEARYEVSIEGSIVSSGLGFNNKWIVGR